jgi:transposase
MAAIRHTDAEVTMTARTWAERLADATVELVPRQVGAVPVVYPLLEALQVRETINELRQTRADIDLGRVVELLILNRLLAPQPLYRVGEWASQTVVLPMFDLARPLLYDQRFGRALEDLHPIIGEAWVTLAARVVQQEGVDLSVVHWDTTAVCLEGAYEDSAWAAYGHNAQQRSDQKQIKVGLEVTSGERMPLLYHLLNGATADITTAVPHLEALAAFLRRPECAHMAVRPLVVGDCKMITPAAVAAAHAHHLFYLGPWEHSKAVEAVIRSVGEDELAQHELHYRPKRHFPAEQPFVPYRGVWRPFPVRYEGQTYPDRGLVVWSAGKQRLDIGKRKVYLKRLLNRLAEIEGFLNQGRYISREYTAHQIALAQRGNPAKKLVAVELSGTDRQLALTFRIDRAALAEAQALDGKYLLGTNAAHLSASHALRYFKAQDGIEKRNADLKGPLQVQPLYLHSDQRIESLVFITLLALLVRALPELRCRQAGLRHSANQVFHAFAPLYATDQVFVDGSRLTQLRTVSPFQQRVLDSLHFPPPTRYLHSLSG